MSKDQHQYAPINQAELKEDDSTINSSDLEFSSAKSGNVTKVHFLEVETPQDVEPPFRRASFLERWKGFILAWVSVILAVLAGASIGPAFKYMSQHGIRSCLSASWRCQCMLIFLLPIAIFEAWSDKKKRVDWFAKKPDLKYPVIVHVFFSGLAWAGNLLTWIVGLQYTSTFKASLIACSHPLMLALWLLIRGDKVSWFGLFGILVAFAGLIISNLPDLFNDNGQAEDGTKLSWMEQALGIILCLIAAACEVVVLFNRIATQKYVPLMQYTFSTTVVVALGATLASIFLEGTGFIHSAAMVDEYGRPIPQTIEIFCTHDNCIFGWMAHKWAAKILLFGLLVGVVCIAGFNYAMQYLPPLVFSSISLLDPALTAVISWVGGVESLPTLYSWFGGFIVMVGVAVISIGEHRHEEGDVRDPVSPPNATSLEDTSIDVSLHTGAALSKQESYEDQMEAMESQKTVMESHTPVKHLFSVVSEDDDDDDTIVLHPERSSFVPGSN